MKVPQFSIETGNDVAANDTVEGAARSTVTAIGRRPVNARVIRMASYLKKEETRTARRYLSGERVTTEVLLKFSSGIFDPASETTVRARTRRRWPKVMIEVPVDDKPVSEKTPGWRRAVYAWLTGTTPSPNPSSNSASPRDPESTPVRIGHYEVVRKLGEGGMGVVYAARDERLERTVAVKMMSSLAGDDTARKRFWREARAAASVNHPNVCQIHEIGEDRGTLFIAMELLEGESLADRLKRGPLSVSETVQIGLGMLAALSALHGRGLMHRDLKPSNVFLTPHGVKLLDFGLARPEEEGLFGGATVLTRSGVAIGTPRYMAPEQALGETLDARCDSVRRGRHPVRDARGSAGVCRPYGRRCPARDASRTSSRTHRLARCCCSRSSDPTRAGEAARR